MTQSFKRILSLVLTFAMVLSCVPAQVLATETCDHSYSVTVSGAGCTEAGSVAYTCELCGDSYTEEIAAAGHDYQQTAAVEATCDAAGSVTYACSACGDSYTEETTAAGGHAYAEGVCAVCGAVDPNAAPAEEPTEAPTEAPAEEPTEVVLDMITAEANDSTQPTEDGGNVTMPPSAVYVAEVNNEGFETLEEAIAAGGGQIILLADCVIEAPIQIAGNTRIINEAGKAYSITAASGVDAIFEIGANGDLNLDHVKLVTEGKYAINLTAANAVAFLNACDISGATEAAIHLENINYTRADYQHVQIYSGTISGETVLELNGSNAQVVVALGGDEENPQSPAELTANSPDGVVVIHGDDHDVQIYGATLTNNHANGILLTMDGDSYLLAAGGVNGGDYEGIDSPMPCAGTVISYRVHYFGNLQAAYDMVRAEENDPNYVSGARTINVQGDYTVSEKVDIEKTRSTIVLEFAPNCTLTFAEGADATLNGYQFVEADVEVKSGAKLTIAGDIEFSGSSFTVEEGAEIVVNAESELNLGFHTVAEAADATITLMPPPAGGGYGGSCSGFPTTAMRQIYEIKNENDLRSTLQGIKISEEDNGKYGECVLTIKQDITLTQPLTIADNMVLNLEHTLIVPEECMLENFGNIVIDGGELEIQSGANMLNCGEVTNDGGQFINNGCVMDCFDIKNTITSSGESSEYYKYDPLQMELFAAMDAEEDYVWTENHTLTGNLSVHLNDRGQNKLFTLDAARIVVPDGMELRIRSRAVLQNAAEIIVEEGGRLLIEGELTFTGGTWLESRGQIVIKDGGKLELQAGAEMVNHGTVTNTNSTFINNGFINDFVGIPAGTITSGSGQCRKYDNDLQLELFEVMGKDDYVLTEDYKLKGDLSIRLGTKENSDVENVFTLNDAKIIVPDGCILYVHSKTVLENKAEIIVEEGGTLWIYGDLSLAEGTWLENRGEIVIENGGKLELQAGAEMVNHGAITNNGELINDGFINDFVGIPAGTITSGSGQCRKYDNDLQLELFNCMENGYGWVQDEDYTLQGDLSIRLGEKPFVLDGVRLYVPADCILYVRSGMQIINGGDLIVQEGSKMVVEGTLEIADGSWLESWGEIEINGGTLHVLGGGEILNCGTMANNGGQFINDGCINDLGNIRDLITSNNNEYYKYDGNLQQKLFDAMNAKTGYTLSENYTLSGNLSIALGGQETENGWEPNVFLVDGVTLTVPSGAILYVHSPVQLMGENARIYVEAGGKLVLNNIIHAGLGTIYMESGAVLEQNAENQYSPITVDGRNDSHITAYYLNSENGEHHEVVNQLWYEPSYEWRMEPGAENPVIFYFNQWNDTEKRWERDSITANELTLSSGLIVEPMDAEHIREDQINGDSFLRLIVKDEVAWDSVETVEHNGVAFDVRVERDPDLGFYSDKVPSNETYLRKIAFGPDMDNSFYFICTNENMTIKGVEARIWEGPDLASGGVVAMKYDNNIWKIQLTNDVTANMDRNFWLQVNVTLVDEYGNEHHWDRGMNCDPWVWAKGDSDASFNINGINYKYFAKFDKYMMDIVDENGNFQYETDTVLPEGVSYDLESNTLTLNNATLESLGIGYSWFDEGRNQGGYDLPNADFKLNLVGENKILGNGNVPLQLRDHYKKELTVTIGGTGSLYVENKNNFGYNGHVNGADVGDVDLIIADSAKVTFHVEGQNKWGNGEDATMHALQGENRSTLRIKDGATLNIETPEILEDRTDGDNFGYAGLANFTEVIVEGQATVNLDCLRLHNDEEHGIFQKFYLRGGTVNINAHIIVNPYDDNGPIHTYDPVEINEGCLLEISGGKMNISAAHNGNVPADGNIIRVQQGTLQIIGGQINLDTNIPRPAIIVDGNEENQGRLMMTGGSLNHNGTGNENTLLNIGYHGRATFAGGTIKSDNSRLEFNGFAGVDQPHAILWTGTNFYGTGNHVIIHGSLKMTGGLFQLNEGRIEVENTATFTGGTLDMNDAVMIVNGSVFAEGAAKLDFDMTDKGNTDGTVLENNNYLAVSGNARIDIDVMCSNDPTNWVSGIRNNGTFHQMGGVVTINSSERLEAFQSYGDVLLNAGEMNLSGITGMQVEWPVDEQTGKVVEDRRNRFEMLDGMTLNIDASRAGLILMTDGYIEGGNLNIHVKGDGTEQAYAFYALNGAQVVFNGGVHNIYASSVSITDKNVYGAGMLVDYNVPKVRDEFAKITVNSGASVTIDADRAIAGWRLEKNEIPAIHATFKTENGVVLNNWIEEYVDYNQTYNYYLAETGSYAHKVIISDSEGPATLQDWLNSATPDANGRIYLNEQVVVTESMTLTKNGEPVILDVADGGKITVRSGATLTIPEGAHLVAKASGTILVEAGGRIVNNGLLVNDGGAITVMDSANGAGYVHGANAEMITHSDGSTFRTKGIPTAYQQLKGNIESFAALISILTEAENGYPSVHIWSPISLDLSDLVIPENVELAIDGQETTARPVIKEGKRLEVRGALSLGNVVLNVEGTLINSGEIHTDPNDNAQITINGIYTDDGQGKLFLNNANVTVNGKVIHNDATSSVDINDRSVVTVADNGVMSIHGSLGVGYWKSAPDASATAGTLNIAGQVEIYNYMEAAAFGEETGGIVNIKDGGNLTISVDPAKDAYGYLSIGGVVNVEAGGALTNKNFVVVSGELNVSGNLHNQAGEKYYSEIVLVDTEDGTAGGKLIASEGAAIDNDASISNSSRKGIIRVENADSYVGDAEGSEVCIFWFDDNTVAQSNLAKSLSFLLYEGSNVGVANAMADHARENGYRNSIVLVADEMVVGNDQRLVSDYVIVTQESELVVNGRMTAWEKLNVRSGGELTITKSGKVYAAKELNTFAAEGEYGDSVIDNRGELEFAPDATAKILGRYQDLGVGTLMQDAAFDARDRLYCGELIGNGGNLDMANITFAPVIEGENAEYKLRTAIAAAYNYDDATIWVKTDVHVTEYLEIPANVTVRIAAEGEKVGMLTLHNDADLDNYGTIYADVPYTALKKITDDANAAYGGSGVYRGFCAVDNGGTSWTSLSWRLKNGTLTISGEGTMSDQAPWQNLYVSKVTLGNAVTHIGSYAFQNCDATITIPRSVVTLGENCFGENVKLKVYHGSEIEDDLKAIYGNDLPYIHELQDGKCIYEGCTYGLEDLLNNESSATAQEKKEELKSIDTESLKSEMINDEKAKENAGGTEGEEPVITLADKLADLESNIQQERKDNGESEVAVSVQMEASGAVADAFESVEGDTTIVGAVLNAEEGATEVRLVISDPENAHIGEEKYEQFNTEASVLFSMTMEGVGDASNLDIPVKITLPVPATVTDLNNLVVMHYADDDAEGERLNYTLTFDENGKAYVNFVLSSFCNFLVGEDPTPVTLTAKVSRSAVTVNTAAEDVDIYVIARTAWSPEELSQRELNSNYTVSDLGSGYILTDAEGAELTLDEALQTVGTYTIVSTFERNVKYRVSTSMPVTLTVNELVYAYEDAESGEQFETLAAAVAARSGATIRLLKDTTESYVMLSNNATLDLNGYTLETPIFVTLNGVQVLNSKTTGILKVPQTGLSLQQSNTYIPVWNETDGYYLVRLGWTTSFKVENGVATYWFLPKPRNDKIDNLEVVKLLKNGAQNNQLTIKARVTWEANDGPMSLELKYNEDVIQTVYTNNPTLSGSDCFVVSVSGYESFSKVKVNAVLVSDYKQEYGSSQRIIKN